MPFVAQGFEGGEGAVGAAGEEGPAAGFGGGDVGSADAFGGDGLAREEEEGLAEGGEGEAWAGEHGCVEIGWRLWVVVMYCSMGRSLDRF